MLVRFAHVAGQAQTGTGKTLAFLITVVNRLLTRFLGEVTAAVDEGTPIEVADRALALAAPFSTGPLRWAQSRFEQFQGLRKEAADLVIAIGGAGGEVNWW